ncbi:MAG: hypothetical protein U5J63_13270 [Fodinibius sp.]|nr:hypothetical protein [Fodinibius sp.]
MSDVGQIERNAQNRIMQLFQDRLEYENLGDWQDRPDNQNVEELLEQWMKQQGYAKLLISNAVHQLRIALPVYEWMICMIATRGFIACFGTG